MSELTDRRAQVMNLFVNAIKKAALHDLTALVDSDRDFVSNRVIHAGIAGADHSSRSQGMAGIPFGSVAHDSCGVITHMR